MHAHPEFQVTSDSFANGREQSGMYAWHFVPWTLMVAQLKLWQ